MKRRTATRHAATTARMGSESDSGNPTLDLSSLVDIAFLLLIYFLVTSSLDPKEADLGFSMMPHPSVKVSDNVPVPDPIHLALRADGSVFLEDELVEPGQPDSRKMPALVTRLKELRFLEQSLRLSDPSKSVQILLAADDQVKGQRFMDVMDALTESGIGSVTLEGFTE